MAEGGKRLSRRGLRKVGRDPRYHARLRLPGYAVVAITTDSLQYGGCMSRPRKWFVGVRVDLLRVPPDQWPAMLGDLAVPPESVPPASCFLLPESHPAVEADLPRRPERLSGAGGRRGKWREEHAAIRRALPGNPPPPVGQDDIDLWAKRGVNTECAPQAV